MSAPSQSLFEKTVRAVCAAVLRERSRSHDASDGAPANLDAAIEFVLHQYASMPDYLLIPFKALTYCFGLSSLLRGAAPFHRLPPQSQRRQIERWRASRIGYARDFVRFYESLVLFYVYSEMENSVEAEPVA